MSATAVTNADAANAAVEAMREKQEQRRSDVVENAATREWLEQQVEQDTRTVAVAGREFEFTQLGTDKVADTVEMAGDDADDDLENVPRMLRQVCDVLAEHCLDPVMDREAFGSLPPEAVDDAFNELAGSMMDADDRERVEQFRND